MKPVNRSTLDPDFEAVRGMLQACIQCGTCTATCPNEFAMDTTPRRLWRLVLMDRRQAVFASRTFALCSSCYHCTLRCPRGLPLTEAMTALKRAAGRRNVRSFRAGNHFSRAFIHSVRRHGRVREMEFMAAYLAHMKSPLLPLRLAPLAMKLMGRGKVPFHWPRRAPGKLEAIFNAVDALEYPQKTGARP